MQQHDIFSYDLPDARIAQRPMRPYDAAKLLQIRRDSGSITESVFADFAGLVSAKDLLVFNDSKVIPARFLGTIEGGATSIEILVLRKVPATTGEKWEALGRPLRKLKEGVRLLFDQGLVAEVRERLSSERVIVEFHCDQGNLHDTMEQVGKMPIPPYIRRGLSDEIDRDDYQSIFAQVEGSVAAPTASLHFTPSLIENIRATGCQIGALTLHVGTASFLPLWHERDTQLRLPETEKFIVSDPLRQHIAQTKQNGGRVIAVGTTVVRALESMEMPELKGETSLFITPGFRFKVVDSLVTNFHQPRTTHLLLVESFMGRALLKESYDFAMTHNFRFLSYGDGMIII